MEPQPLPDSRGKYFFSKLKHPSSFSKPQLLIFVIAFALIGYLIYHSFAAAPVVATLEGENMLPQVSNSSTSSVNLALNKPATASSTQTSNGTVLKPSNAFDGNTTTRWSSNYSDPQWLQVDLGSTQSFSQVVIQWETAYAKAYQLQTSNDGTTWTSIYSTTSGTGGTQSLNISGSGRYVRMYGTVRGTKWGYSIYEMQVWGSPTTSVNLALNKPATASSTQTSNGTVLKPSNAFDGNTTTRWSSNYSDPQWLQVDLGSTQSFSQVVIQWETAYAKAYQLQTSNDGTTWTSIYSTTSGTGGTQSLNISGSGRYVRMYGTVRGTKWGYSIYEMQILSSMSSSASFSQVVSDASASNGKEMELTGNGTIKGTFSLPSTASSATVIAKADLCNSVGAAMTVSVDSSQLISTTVNATSLTSYNATTNLAAGSHTLSISYTNDTSTSTCDRNLYIDVTDFYGPTPPPTVPTVALSASPSTLTAGQSSTLTWTSTNATSCTASGAWSGTEPTSGSISTGAINQTSTYSLTCTGTGGSATASTSVTVTSPPSTSSIYWGAWMEGPNTYGYYYGNPAPDGQNWMTSPWGGITGNTWDRFEQNAGKKVTIDHYGQPNMWIQTTFNSSIDNIITNRGAIPLLDMDSGSTSLADIANGVYDSQIKTWATNVKAWGKPLFFRWDWEMNGTWFGWGAQAKTNPSDYVKAWQRVHNDVVSAGATNVTWVWCPNVEPGSGTPLSSLYPGDAYVDWTCMDGYNTSTSSSWQTFSQIFGQTYKDILNIAPTKPVMIGETSSREVGGSKAAWISDALNTQLPNNFPKIRAFVWFNWRIAQNGTNEPWPIESSSTSQAAFKAGIDTSYYKAGNSNLVNLPLLTKVPIP